MCVYYVVSLCTGVDGMHGLGHVRDYSGYLCELLCLNFSVVYVIYCDYMRD